MKTKMKTTNKNGETIDKIGETIGKMQEKFFQNLEELIVLRRNEKI